MDRKRQEFSIGRGFTITKIVPYSVPGSVTDRKSIHETYRYASK